MHPELRNILLVGSIPLNSAEEVFQACSKYIGPYVSSLPDGEFGPRTSWIRYLARDVYSRHPDLDTLGHQRLDRTGGASWKDTSAKWTFKVKPGAKPQIETGYARFALESYDVFSGLQSAGVIPEHVRFQVCFPARSSAFLTYFENPNDWPIMAEAYEAAFGRDVQALLSRIPSDKLAIQLDVCIEIMDLHDSLPWSPARPGKFDNAIASVTGLAAKVPSDVLLGLHWCYGTLGGWPMVPLEELELCTRLTNKAVAAIGRRVDYVHIPVVPDADDRFFEPVEALDVGGTKIYFGLLHHTDGMDGFKARLAVARRHGPRNFGVASVCGYGRLSPQESRQAFELHEAAGRYLAQ